MNRFLPSSLLGQVMLSVAFALLISQFVSIALLFQAGEERREAAAATTLAFRLINGRERAERGAGRDTASAEQAIDRQALRQQRQRLRAAGGPDADQVARDRLPPRLRYTVTPAAPIAVSSGTMREDLAKRLREVLEREGLTPYSLSVTVLQAGDDPLLQRIAQRRPRLAASSQWRERDLIIAAIQLRSGGNWESARLLAPKRAAGGLGVLFVQTLVTFVFLIVPLFFVLRRITRPLAALTRRVDDFSRDPENVIEIEETGPADTRQLIAAHNTMEARIAALLDEKDVMLGAIGHDLKTPLAALRVRIESVSDDFQRAKMAASIEDITATLDDILMLARMGRRGSIESEAVELGALTSSVVEEFEDMNEPVRLVDPQRLVAQAQVTWVKRALRNLVTNALRYAGSATVSMVRGESHAIIRVEDDGPGIPEEALGAMMEPFTRGEASRNRSTGGTGLGLTLARAIAKVHGGELVLENRDKSEPDTAGLRAEIRLPL